MTDEQIHELALALEASYQANGMTGYGCADEADQYMDALPQPDYSDISNQRDEYASYVLLAAEQGRDQRSIDYIRCKCVRAALEVAFIRGDLNRRWRDG